MYKLLFATVVVLWIDDAHIFMCNLYMYYRTMYDGTINSKPQQVNIYPAALDYIPSPRDDINPFKLLIAY